MELYGFFTGKLLVLMSCRSTRVYRLKGLEFWKTAERWWSPFTRAKIFRCGVVTRLGHLPHIVVRTHTAICWASMQVPSALNTEDQR